MHQHKTTTLRLTVSCFLVAIIVALEVVGLEKSGSVILLAHLADVGADLASYLLVLATAAYSWLADWRGRDHRHNHPEEVASAVVNLAIMALGLVVATVVALEHFFNPEVVNSRWALVGPAAAVAIYYVVTQVTKSDDQNIALSTARAHLRGDLRTSVVVLASSLVVLLSQTAWVNPLASLLIVVILSRILREQFKEFRGR